MTLDEILSSYDCSDVEPGTPVILDRSQAIEAIKQWAVSLVADEPLPPWTEWYAKTKDYGGTIKEYARLSVIEAREKPIKDRIKQKIQEAE